MSSSASPQVRETTLEVPVELATQFQGLTIDAGSTLLKFIYRSKDEENGVETEKHCVTSTPTCRLRAVSFLVNDLPRAFDYLRPRADVIRHEDERPTISTTGITILRLEEHLTQGLNIKVDNSSEFECVAKALVYLASKLTRSQLVEPFIIDIVAGPVAQSRALMSMMRMFAGKTLESTGVLLNEGIRRVLERSNKVTDENELAMVDAEPDMFPCLVVMCGSTTAFLEVHSDGSTCFLDSCSRSSKSFLGLGNLLVETKTFDELVGLAMFGDERKVDWYTDEYQVENETLDDKTYNSISTVSLATCRFAHAINGSKGDLKREDVASSLLSFIVSDIVQHALHVSCSRRLKRVFFTGGFCTHPFVRRCIAAEFVLRMLRLMTFREEDTYLEFDFIRHGGYLGALGCALNDIHKINRK